MQALVTGGAGFIGSHLARQLAEQGHEVTVLDDGSTGDLDQLPTHIDTIEGDVREGGTVLQALDHIDVVFHQAGLVSVERSIRTPHESHAINVTGTMNVLEAALIKDTRVVVASSAAIYGQPEVVPIEESHPKRPTSPYGLDKLTADHYTRLYHDLYDLETVALRYFNVYGVGQTAGDYTGVIRVFIEQALNDEPITVHGDGEQTRDFIHVDDVVRANLLAAETDHVGEAYNIATGKETSIRELAELIQEVTDTDSDIVHVEEREGDIERSVADIEKARESLDYDPEVSLHEGLERTIEWFESNE